MTTTADTPSGDDETGSEGVDPTGVAAGPNPIEDTDATDATDPTEGDADGADGTDGPSS